VSGGERRGAKGPGWAMKGEEQGGRKRRKQRSEVGRGGGERRGAGRRPVPPRRGYI